DKTIRIVVTRSHTAGSTNATSGATVTVGAQSPGNTTTPSISGTAQDGHTLTVDKGAWSGTAPISYAYQWRRCDSTGANCSDVDGATSAAYDLGASDIDRTIRVVVTATNAGGSSTATSPASD